MPDMNENAETQQEYLGLKIDKENKVYWATACLICGESVPIKHIPIHNQYVICDNCKKAVLYIREQMNSSLEILEKE